MSTERLSDEDIADLMHKMGPDAGAIINDPATTSHERWLCIILYQALRELRERRDAERDAREDYTTVAAASTGTHANGGDTPAWRPVAPVGDEPNPYKFTVQVRESWSVNYPWNVCVVSMTSGAMIVTDRFSTEAEAREHARLIAAALRTVEVTE